jgi:hypothetical protein
MASFKDWCGLPFVQGAIDYTQIHIQKPKGVFKFFFLQIQSSKHVAASSC